jgi:SpoVK/Ycf46/Vps4 family AAA+-type ATPase
MSLSSIITELNSSKIPSMRTPLKSIRSCHYKLEEKIKRKKNLMQKLKETVKTEVEDIKEKKEKKHFRNQRNSQKNSKTVENEAAAAIAKAKLRQTLPEDENNHWNIVVGDDMGRLFILEVTEILIKMGVLWTENRPKEAIEKFSHNSPYEKFELKTSKFQKFKKKNLFYFILLK